MKQKEKRTLHGVLTLMLLLGLMLIPGLLPETACATGGNPQIVDGVYQIEDYDDLKAFAEIVNGTHPRVSQNTAACGKLMNDITCDDKKWVPIGSLKYSYIGHFDGDNHIIKGLSNEEQTNVSNATYQGLFGCIGKQGDTVTGKVKNVGVVGGKITGKLNVGGVVGLNDGGTITNCYNTGAVSGIGINVGGVAGHNNGGDIINCYNTGAVSGLSTVGGVVGYYSGGTITNCYNTGAVSGTGYVGGVAGHIHSGTITNCHNTGAVSGTGDSVGGVAGQNNGGTITNCYNTGAVSGLSIVGGVVGYYSGGTITNCYNTGAVSGTGYVGGVAGYIYSGTITNCYNSGAVNGRSNVGGVAGYSDGETIDYCYYNKEITVVKAIGSGTAGTNVKGLETSQMVGAAALKYMTFSYKSPSENPWLTKEAGKDADSGTYYEYYPHLKGFAYDISKKAADWPGKLTTSAEWSDDAVSYDYNGSAQGPKVTKVITSPKPVEIPDGMTAQWRAKIVEVEDVDNPKWGEPIDYEPSLSGVYKLTIKDGDKVIEEIVYIILKKKNSSNSNDYNVKYQVQKKTAGGGTEWSDIDSKDIVDVGNYKAVIELTGRPDLEEKVFQIKKAPLTITAKDQTLTYNGQTQGEGDTAYEDPAEIAEKVEVKGLQGSDGLTSITIDGQGEKVGEYPIEITGYVINGNDAAKDNYDCTLIPGKLTITQAPQPSATSIDNAPVVLDPAPLTYTGQPVTPVIQTIGGKTLQEGRDYTVRYTQGDTLIEAPTDAGTYTMTITGRGNFSGSTSTEFTIGKAAGTLTAQGNKVKARSKTIKLKKPKKISADKAYTIEGTIGELAFSKVKANKASKKFKVNATTGQIKVKKGLKKGRYKLTVLISDSGDKNHEMAEAKAIVKIRIRK